MKHPFRSHILPFFTMGAGGLGLVLRLWLFSKMDENTLLPVGHWTDAALYILSALTLGVLFLATRELTPRKINKPFVRISGTCAYAIGGLSLLLTAVLNQPESHVRLGWLALAASLVGGLAMFYMAALKLARKRLPY